MLQHRGQDSAGMVTTDGQRYREHRDNGLVREVFGSQALLNMMSGVALSVLTGWHPLPGTPSVLYAGYMECCLLAVSQTLLSAPHNSGHVFNSVLMLARGARCPLCLQQSSSVSAAAQAPLCTLAPAAISSCFFGRIRPIRPLGTCGPQTFRQQSVRDLFESGRLPGSSPEVLTLGMALIVDTADAGQTGLGHVRYPTAGSLSAQEAQPFFVNSPLGIYLIHNGNLTNTEELRDFLNGSQSFYSRHLRTESDSEVRPWSLTRAWTYSENPGPSPRLGAMRTTSSP